jgi:hypothetical protein
MSEVLTHDAVSNAGRHAMTALAACTEGAALEEQLKAVGRTLQGKPVNTVALRRAIAAKLRAAERYVI